MSHKQRRTEHIYGSDTENAKDALNALRGLEGYSAVIMDANILAIPELVKDDIGYSYPVLREKGNRQNARKEVKKVADLNHELVSILRDNTKTNYVFLGVSEKEKRDGIRKGVSEEIEGLIELGERYVGKRTREPRVRKDLDELHKLIVHDYLSSLEQLKPLIKEGGFRAEVTKEERGTFGAVLGLVNILSEEAKDKFKNEKGELPSEVDKRIVAYAITKTILEEAPVAICSRDGRHVINLIKELVPRITSEEIEKILENEIKKKFGEYSAKLGISMVDRVRKNPIHIIRYLSPDGGKYVNLSLNEWREKGVLETRTENEEELSEKLAEGLIEIGLKYIEIRSIEETVFEEAKLEETVKEIEKPIQETIEEIVEEGFVKEKTNKGIIEETSIEDDKIFGALEIFYMKLREGAKERYNNLVKEIKNYFENGRIATVEEIRKSKKELDEILDVSFEPVRTLAEASKSKSFLDVLEERYNSTEEAIYNLFRREYEEKSSLLLKEKEVTGEAIKDKEKIFDLIRKGDNIENYDLMIDKLKELSDGIKDKKAVKERIDKELKEYEKVRERLKETFYDKKVTNQLELKEKTYIPPLPEVEEKKVEYVITRAPAKVEYRLTENRKDELPDGGFYYPKRAPSEEQIEILGNKEYLEAFRNKISSGVSRKEFLVTEDISDILGINEQNVQTKVRKGAFGPKIEGGGTGSPYHFIKENIMYFLSNYKRINGFWRNTTFII